MIVLLSSVTAPLRASSLPSTVAPVFSVIDVRARIVPLKFVVVPSVAELPTCQKTLHGEAPLTSFTWLADAVISVDAAWKMKTASAVALRVERDGSGQVEGPAAVDAGVQRQTAERARSDQEPRASVRPRRCTR